MGLVASFISIVMHSVNESLCFVFYFLNISINLGMRATEPVKEKEARATFFHLPQTKFGKVSVRKPRVLRETQGEDTNKIKSKLN